MRFEGRRVLMSGGSGGIGSTLCRRLVDEGALVTTIDRSGGAPGARHLRGDLSTPDGIEAAAAAAAAKDWDILINMAGVQHFGRFTDEAPDHLYRSYAVNLLAPVRLTQSVLPRMRARRRGQIVNIGSIFGSIAFAHFVTYSSAKAGLRGFSEALRREVAGSGVDVTYIAPRAVLTALRNEKIARFAALVGLRLDSPEHVAERMVAAIGNRRREVYVGFPESLMVRVNAVAPRLVDQCLVANDRKAQGLFPSPTAPS